jgi:hypothetical protein
VNDGQREQPVDPGTEHGSGSDARGDDADRRWRIAAMVLVPLAVLSMGGVAWLLLNARGDAGDELVLACIPSRDFTADAEGERVTCPPEDATYVDGLVLEATDEHMDLRLLDGGSIQVRIRTPDRPWIDVPHARQHSALGQPLRVFTIEHEGEDVVVWIEDPPL